MREVPHSRRLRPRPASCQRQRRSLHLHRCLHRCQCKRRHLRSSQCQEQIWRRRSSPRRLWSSHLHRCWRARLPRVHTRNSRQSLPKCRNQYWRNQTRSLRLRLRNPRSRSCPGQLRTFPRRSCRSRFPQFRAIRRPRSWRETSSSSILHRRTSYGL